MISTFTKKITVEPYFQPDFFFNRIATPGGICFHVSVLDKNGQLCHFTMAESWGKWKIVIGPQPPDWIMNLEGAFDKIICQSMLS
jgi:hypothetical protein